MHSYPGDLTPAIVAVVGALVFLAVVVRLWGWYQSRTLRLRLLTGTRPQHAALRRALAPVLGEFLPLLDRAGQDVRAIVLVPTLLGSEGEALVAEIEQLGGSAAFVVRPRWSTSSNGILRLRQRASIYDLVTATLLPGDGSGPRIGNYRIREITLDVNLRIDISPSAR